MARWNPYAEEVLEMRQTLRDYGGYKKYVNQPGTDPNSYKQQALLELAARLEAEERIKDLEGLRDLVYTVLDCQYTGTEYALAQIEKLHEWARKNT